jgi:hypothetical protein
MTTVGRHIRVRRRLLALLVLAGLLPAAAGCAGTATQKPKKVDIQLDQDKSQPLNDAQLQALVMGMADTYTGGMLQAAMVLETQAVTPADRQMAHGGKYLTTLAALTIAAGPSPEAALIDLLVLTRMMPVGSARRLSLPDLSPQMAAHAPEYVAALHRLEELIWRDADRVLSEEQQQQLREVVDEWLAEHPLAMAVFYIRLSDFTEIRNPRSAAVVKGMLADVGEATRAVDDIRLLGERALWLSSRMPVVFGYQVERTLYDVVAQEEAQQLINDSLRFTDAAVGIRKEVADAPATLTSQREALIADLTVLQEETIDNLMDGIARERQAFLDEVDARKTMAHEVLEDLQRTIQAARELVDSVDVVVSRFDARETAPGREPLDMADVRDAASEAALAADEFTELLVVAQELLASPYWQQRATEIGSAWGRVEHSGRGWMTYGFRRTLLVIGAALLAVVIYRFIAVKLIK